jgi:hypothetical protein
MFPEPSTWAMMIPGFAIIGFIGSQSRLIHLWLCFWLAGSKTPVMLNIDQPMNVAGIVFGVRARTLAA